MCVMRDVRNVAMPHFQEAKQVAGFSIDVEHG